MLFNKRKCVVILTKVVGTNLEYIQEKITLQFISRKAVHNQYSFDSIFKFLLTYNQDTLYDQQTE